MSEDKMSKIKKALIAMFLAANEEFIRLIVNDMAIESADQAKTISLGGLISKINGVTSYLQNSLKGKTESAISSAYGSGFEQSAKAGKYTDSQQSTLDRLMSETYNDLLVATKYMSESAKKFVRIKVSESMQLQSAIRQGNKSLINSLVRSFSESSLTRDAYRQGFTGIVDKAGRRWNLETYATMVVNTKMSQAHIYGTADAAHEIGIHLFQISSHNAIDACINWEGAIISVGEDIDGYPSYEDLAGSGEIFHPNCKHVLTPISERVVSRIRKRK